MLSPYCDRDELKYFLPIMSKEEMEALLKAIKNHLRTEDNSKKLMRLLDNKEILEKAIDNY